VLPQIQIFIKRVTSTLGPEPFNLPKTCQFISELINDAIRIETKLTLSEFVWESNLKKYGFEKIASQYVEQGIRGIHAHQKKHSGIKLFARFFAVDLEGQSLP
jgi:hypothetical protein